MSFYVCSGAKMKCSMGSQQSALNVLHPVKPVRVEGNPVAAMLDHKPLLNIKPFGQCKSLANPAVAAATAAANGKLQPMPCIPNTVTPWMGTKMNVRVKGNPALLDSSKLLCMCGPAGGGRGINAFIHTHVADERGARFFSAQDFYESGERVGYLLSKKVFLFGNFGRSQGFYFTDPVVK